MKAQSEPLLQQGTQNEKYQRQDTDSPAGFVSPINAPRVKRDLCWAVFFAIFWMFSLLIVEHALSTGDPKRLYNGIDSNGNVCGMASARQQVTGERREDTASRPLAFLPNPEHTDLVFCVNKCASEASFTSTEHRQYVCFDQYENITGVNDACHFNADKLGVKEFNVHAAACFNQVKAMTTGMFGLLTGSGYEKLPGAANHSAGLLNRGYLSRCFPLYIAKPFMHFCVPELRSNDSNATIAPGTPPTAVSQRFEEYFGAGSSVFGRMMAELQASSWVITTSLCLSGFLALVWISILPCVGPLMIWGTLALTVLFLGLTSMHLCMLATSMASHVTYQYKLTLGLGVAVGLLGVIAVAVACCMASRIQLALRLTEHAGKALQDVPSMLFTPVCVFVLFAAFMYFWIYSAAYLLSSGTLNIDTASHVRSFTYDQHTQLMLVVHLFSLLWNSAFLLDMGKLIVSMCVSVWYWAPFPCTASGEWVEPLQRMQPGLGEAGADLPSLHFPVFPQAALMALKNSVGSVCLGSFLTALMGFIRIVFEYVKRQALDKTRNNCCVRASLCLMSCCLACIEGMLEFVSDNAYIQIAMFGGNFCQSASAGFRLLMRNPLRMMATGIVSSVLVFAGKVFVITCSVGYSVWMMSHSSALSPTSGGVDGYSGAAYALLPVAFSAFGAWLVCSVVFNVFVTSIQTMLQCVCEDEERNDGSREHPYFLSESLQNALNSVQHNN